MIRKSSKDVLPCGSCLFIPSNVLFIASLMLFLATQATISYCQTQRVAGHLSLVVDENVGQPASHGIEILTNALKKLNVRVVRVKSIEEATSSQLVVIGTAQNRTIKDLIENGELNLSQKKESLAIKKIKISTKEILIIAGSDERGLLYALTDAARQIENAGKATPVINAIAEISESPEAPVRSMIVFLHNEADEKDWYYSKEYWNAYFEMLATNRWNTFNLVFSHQTGYLAPMYPYHVQVESHPEVKVEGLSDEQRKKNLDMLRYISSTAKEYGLDFTLSVWQQIAWATAHAVAGQSQKNSVSGYSVENMTDYTYHALKKLLQECPGITGVQLRMNYESGVDFKFQTAFFRDAVFRAMKESGRPVLLELRDIGLLKETQEAAMATGLPLRVSHKYWAEDLMFPYHPPRIMHTYSYGDWLKYPRKIDQIYQVWSLGSHRLLQWGDPEFVRRFGPTTTFQDAVGFEICAPLSQKGFGNESGAFRIFEDKTREYYKWEFQKYWSYYQLFGRLTYNSTASDEFWTNELSRRFGTDAAKPIANMYRAGSRILPKILSVAIANFNMYVWPEKDMGGLINYYMTLKPFDPALYSGFQEYIDDVLAGRTTGKTNPEQVASQLEALALETEQFADAAKPLVTKGKREFWATEMDFRILSGMARYFSHKIRVAISLGFFYKTGDANQLQLAIKHGEAGLEVWKQVSRLADEIYSDHLVFGPGSVGHWKDNIVFVENDLKQLNYQKELFNVVQNADYAFDFGPPPFSQNTEAYNTGYVNDFMVERRFKGVYPTTKYDPQVGYGWISGEDLSAVQPKNPTRYTWWGATKEELKNIPEEALLGDFITGTKPAVFRVDLPDGHYQGTIIISDKSPNPTAHGPMEVTGVERFETRPLVDSRIVAAGETIIHRFNMNMTGDRYIFFKLGLNAAPGAHFIISALTFTRVEPHVKHVPLLKASPGKPVTITSSVTLPPPPNDSHPLSSLGVITSNSSTLRIPTEITRVSLMYTSGSDNSARKVDMTITEGPVYKVEIPAADVREEVLSYYFEGEDDMGQVIRLPKPSDPDLYFKLDITSDNSPPTVRHTAVAEHAPGQSLEIVADVNDNSSVQKVLLYYRPTRQTMEYSTVTMTRVGEKYIATIPGKFITSEYDMMYYFEAFDSHGNACIYPNADIETPYFVVKVKR
jgi:hypothetical protein